MPEKSNLLSASVLAENCAVADAYATAFMALGMEKSKEMLVKLENVDVYFIYAEENDEVKVFASEGFEKVLVKE
jgi:thiamine biosynthesis lipoprotein